MVCVYLVYFLCFFFLHLTLLIHTVRESFQHCFSFPSASFLSYPRVRVTFWFTEAPSCVGNSTSLFRTSLFLDL